MDDDLFILNPEMRDVAMGIAPYTVHRQAAGCTSMSVLFLGFTIVYTLFHLLPMTINIWIEHFRLSSASVTTTATVVDRYTEEVGDSTEYYIVYEFRHTLPNGEPIVQQGEDSVSSDEYDRLEPGMQIEVFYDPNDPAISDMQPPNILEPASKTGSAIFGAVFWNGISGYISYLCLKAAWKERKLAREGQLIYGTLTSVTGDTDSDGDFLVDLHYRFVTPQGREINGHKHEYSNVHRNTPLPPVGTRVAIWYANDKNYIIL